MLLKRMMVVLGGSGFLGSSLCNKLVQNEIDVVVFSKSLGCDLTTSAGQNQLKDFLLQNDSCIDIVMMAAKLGSKLFDEDPVNPFLENTTVDNNTIKTLLSIGKKFHVTYYSTSEVYGNMDSYDHNHLPKIDPSYPRSLYAQEKLMTETLLNYLKQTGKIQSLRIMRPFNVSGFRQKRGIIYEMVKSALEENMIYYAPNQSREITFLDDATDSACKLVMNRIEGTFDLTSRFHISLEDLANCVKNAFEMIYPERGSIETKEMPNVDIYIKHRGTVPLMSSKDEFNDFTKKMIEHNVISGIVDSFHC